MHLARKQRKILSLRRLNLKEIRKPLSCLRRNLKLNNLKVIKEAGFLRDGHVMYEVLYRDQNDFRSKYRAVIDYFDAVKIALTATPALHTTEIFGKPVYSYDYRTAVIDGFLVDHDAPHIIKTKLSEEGISFEKGSTVPIYDPVTNEITNSSELEDDLKFEVEDFNRRVVDKSETVSSFV